MEEHHTSKKRKIQQSNNNNNSSQSLTRKVKMYCPAASKIAEIMAWDDQRLDLGTIARIFGLEPRTLKLNGHFISRGVDLIASSVTWKSLLSFFSSKGLSTGTDSSGALVVDGKLSKSGSKRGCDPGPIVDNGVHCVDLYEGGVGVSRIHGDEEINLYNHKKLKESHMANCGESTGMKRKNWLENISPLIKRARTNGSYSDDFSRGSCGLQMRHSMKRMREDEVVTSSCKRTR